ncbi:MAG TPA: hypothetical protein DDY49_10780 [Paenibacillaceae bacterium]|nr:hypothetical protein [Paenibacillaceae bacterium]
MRKVLIAFDSTQQALRAETLLEFLGIDLDTRPTPKAITAGCALSIDFPMDDFPLVQETFKREHVEIKGFYYEKNGQYISFEGEK